MGSRRDTLDRERQIDNIIDRLVATEKRLRLVEERLRLAAVVPELLVDHEQEDYRYRLVMVTDATLDGDLMIAQSTTPMTTRTLGGEE